MNPRLSLQSLVIMTIASLGHSLVTFTGNVTHTPFALYQQATLDPQKTIRVFLTNISSQVKFVVFQAHHQIHKESLRMSFINPSTVGEDEELPHGSFVTGMNIGLVSQLDSVQENNSTVWLTNLRFEAITVLFQVVLYSNSDPIPGGCNLEFDVETSPFLRVSEDTQAQTQVTFQLARLGSPRGVVPPSCDTSLQFIRYDVYSYFLRENDYSQEELFRGVNLMSTPGSIKRHGSIVKDFSHQKTKATILSYPGRGVIYNVIVSFNNKVSCYVPAASYNCDLESNLDSCGNIIMSELPLVIFLSILACLGLVVNFRGHEWFDVQVCWSGFLFGFIISSLSLSKYSDLTSGQREVSSLAIGFIACLVCIGLWKVMKFPPLFMLVSGLLLGFLMISTVLFSTIGNEELFRSDFNYWIILGTGTFVIPVILLPFGPLLSIFSCTVVGSYNFVFAIDRFLGGSLAFIVLNVFKRAAFKDVLFASNNVPFQTKDIVLAVTWAILVLAGLTVQLYLLESRRSSRRSSSRSRSSRHRRSRHRSSRTRSRSSITRSVSRRRTECRTNPSRPTAPPSEPAVDEFQPLITNQVPTSIVYQAI